MTTKFSDEAGPASYFYISQRLRLHYLDWGNHDKPLLLLVHGQRDHAHSWDWVARRLKDDYHVIAPDLRGHGDSAWAIGGNYAITDFVLDIAQLLAAVDKWPVTIVSHSMGAAISLLYTGLFPDRVRRIVAVEGLGPPPERLAELRDTPADVRVRTWIEKMQGLASRSPKRYDSIDAAADRMQQENSFLSEQQARHLTVHGVARNEDGSYSWKFDNYVRTSAPYRFDEREMKDLWGQITCPVMLVRGTASWASDPSVDGRMEAFQNASFKNFEGAGHWVHHDRLDDFVALVKEFVGDS
jgi:pimeloyl-ACP methyl ester carboxylesterase